MTITLYGCEVVRGRRRKVDDAAVVRAYEAGDKLDVIAGDHGCSDSSHVLKVVRRHSPDSLRPRQSRAEQG